MPSKKKPPTLPEKLRQLADEIEAAQNPQRPKTPEERTASILADLQDRSFKDRLIARRKAEPQPQGDDSDTQGSGGGGAPAAPPQAPRPRRPR